MRVMKDWEKILKEREVYENNLYYDRNDSCEYYLRYEYIWNLLQHMVDTHDEDIGDLATGYLKFVFSTKWHMFEIHFNDNPQEVNILIECAIDNQIPAEFLTFLIDWKYRNGVFEGKDWNL